MQRQIEIEPFLDDGHQHISGDGDPYLALDGILGGAEEPLDAQVLFDPFEEQFHLPTAFVECADTRGRDAHVVGQEHQRFASLRIFETNATQPLGVPLFRVETRELDVLIADQPGCTIYRAGIDPLELEVRFGACDEEGAGLMQGMQARVCSLIAALVSRNGAQGNIDRHRSMVVESSA